MQDKEKTQNYTEVKTAILEDLVEWWQKENLPKGYNRDIVLPKLIEEKLKRYEEDF